jgi:hypothetical protein
MSPAQRRSTKRRPVKSPSSIRTWQDDPDSGLPVIEEPVPTLQQGPLAVDIAGPKIPAGKYRTHTQDFRFWTAAEALRRASTFWSTVVPSGTSWEPGPTLVANLDAGEELNAYYDRKGLSFFHKRIGQRMVYSGESPDVVTHELGHAVLDSIKPELWDAASDEAAAFHEGFADCSALLSALQLSTLRETVLEETDGSLYRSSQLSRLAEQLGAAIRTIRPDLVEPDCLRNAVNSFVYQQPEDLPQSAPAWQLSSEPHSFSRVWSGGFFEGLAKMLAVQTGSPTGDELALIATDAAQLLVTGVLKANVVPDFFSQVAAQMIDASRSVSKGRYTDALKSAFVRRGIISLDSLQLLGGRRRGRTRAKGIAADGGGGDATMKELSLHGGRYGLGDQALTVLAPTETRVLDVRAAAFTIGPVSPPPSSDAATAFVEDLFKRGRVDIGDKGDPDTRLVHPGVRKTHELKERTSGYVLVRRAFDCGFGVE